MIDPLANNPKCRECGYIHPLDPSGKCRISETQKIQETQQGRIIMEFVNKLINYLNNSEKYEKEIRKIKALLIL